MLDELYAAAADSPPTYTVVKRLEHAVGGGRGPDNVTVQNLSQANRANGLGPVQDAPDPIRQSHFWFTGRADPFAGVPYANWLNIKAPASVMEDMFGTVRKVSAPFLVFMRGGHGGQAPFTNRSIIERPGTQSYGDMTAIDPGGLSGYSPPGAVNVNGFTLSPGDY